VLLIILLGCSLYNNNHIKPGWEPPEIRLAAGAAWGPHDWIVFTYTDSGMFLVKSDGGDLHLVTEYCFENPDWFPDGKWFVANDLGGRIFKISIDGDSIIQITQQGRKFYPSVSPDGKKIAFSTPDSDSIGPRGLRILDLETMEEKFVFPYGFDPSWSPDGHKLVFCGWIQEGDQWIGGDLGSVVVVDTSGKNPQIIHLSEEGNGVESPSFSPNGSKIVFRKPYAWGGGVGQIWIVNSSGNYSTKLTKRGGRWPAWSPDGSKIVYTRYSLNEPYQKASGDLFIMNADGSGKRRLTFFNQN